MAPRKASDSVHDVGRTKSNPERTVHRAQNISCRTLSAHIERRRVPHTADKALHRDTDARIDERNCCTAEHTDFDKIRAPAR